jgi:hypothetical protein
MPELRTPKQEELDTYANTIARLEPEVAMIDAGAYYASAAISLKRIADSLNQLTMVQEHLLDRLDNISTNIVRR